MSSGKCLHRQYQELLLGEIGLRFLANHAMCTRPWVSRMDSPPETIRAIGALEFPFFDECTERGAKPKGHSADVVFVCGAGKATTYHGENHTIAVEVKSSLENLVCDPKIPGYFGRTDYIYLAVPDALLIYALIRTSVWDHVGVVSLSSGSIYKPAKRQVGQLEERIRILERLLLEKEHIVLKGGINVQSDKGLSVLPALQRVDWSSGIPSYREIAT